MTTFDQPLTFKSGVTLANRLMMSPMTTQQSFYNGTVTQEEIHYYAERAKGLGAVITGAANVQATGKGWPGELSIEADTFLPELGQLARAIQAQGAKAIVQIFHAGRMTHAATLGGTQPVSASAVPAQRPDAEVPRELTVPEIQAIVTAFGEATRRAIQAGFDGVELHGANTYLLQQFFSPHSNRRTDDYGGDRTRRYRFIHEVIDAVFAAVDRYATRPFLVGYRVSPEEYETPGIRVADTLWLLKQLGDTRLDYVHLSLNDYTRVAKEGRVSGPVVAGLRAGGFASDPTGGRRRRPHAPRRGQRVGHGRPRSGGPTTPVRPDLGGQTGQRCRRRHAYRTV